MTASARNDSFVGPPEYGRFEDRLGASGLLGRSRPLPSRTGRRQDIALSGPGRPNQDNPVSLTRHPLPVYSRVAVTAPDPSFVKVDGCDLCRAARITPWYHEDDICWVAECDVCDVPMVVWRFHGTEPPAEHLTHMHERLREIATRQLGEIYVDDHMRNIPDHYHAHGRPKGGFFGHGLRRPAS